MGYNTVAVLYNDHTANIRDMPDFGRRVAQAMRGWSWHDRDPSAVHFGSGMIVSQAHADYDQVVVVGQNRGRPLSECNDLSPLGQEQLADALRRHGWTVRKKR